MLVSKFKTGFTLIELLVVMAVLGIVMSLVGPLALNSFEKAQARIEIMTLTRWMDDLSYRAFLSHQDVILELKGKQAYASSNKVSFAKTIDFEYLYFQPQTVTFNRNGFSQLEEIRYQKGNQQIAIQLNRSLNVR